MEVRVRIPCPDCEGTGTAYSPEWHRWYVKLESERPVGIPYHVFIQEFAKNNPDPAGPEDYPCRACAGTGYPGAVGAPGKPVPGNDHRGIAFAGEATRGNGGEAVTKKKPAIQAHEYRGGRYRPENAIDGRVARGTCAVCGMRKGNHA